jgi:thiol-disulfide isomerase/thioredoxin
MTSNNIYNFSKDGVIELEDGRDIKNLKICNKDLLGQFGLIKVYAPWCGYCHALKENAMKFLGENMKEYDFNVCAINSENPKNKELCQRLQVRYFPYLMIHTPSGQIAPIEDDLNNSRSIEKILEVICRISNGLCSVKSIGKDTILPSKVSCHKDAICCEKVGDKIECQPNMKKKNTKKDNN